MTREPESKWSPRGTGKHTTQKTHRTHTYSISGHCGVVDGLELGTRLPDMRTVCAAERINGGAAAEATLVTHALPHTTETHARHTQCYTY